MTSRVRSKNKGIQAKRKNSVKNRDQTQKKRYDKETENSVTVAGSRTQLICKQCKQFLDYCTTVTYIVSKINFVISKQFFSAIDAV